MSHKIELNEEITDKLTEMAEYYGISEEEFLNRIIRYLHYDFEKDNSNSVLDILDELLRNNML